MSGFPKSGVLPSEARHRRAVKLSAAEREAKQVVRRRDQTCRFPACGCRQLGFALHVAHDRHKGMGGNPAGDRSSPDKLILLCAARHLANPVSLDRGTLRIMPRTAKGFAGPCVFEVRSEALKPFGLPPGWWEVGRELRHREFAAFTPEQAVVLDWLASMKV